MKLEPGKYIKNGKEFTVPPTLPKPNYIELGWEPKPATDEELWICFSIGMAFISWLIGFM